MKFEEKTVAKIIKARGEISCTDLIEKQAEEARLKLEATFRGDKEGIEKLVEDKIGRFSQTYNRFFRR